MTKLERIGNYIVLTDLVSGHRDDYPADDLYFRWEQNTISFNHKLNRSLIHQYQFSELVDENESAWVESELLLWLRKNTGDAGAYTYGGLDVSVQDQHTPIIIALMSTVSNETTLTSAGVIDSRVITVADPTGFDADDYISIFSVADNRFFLGFVIAVNGNDITVDTPLNFAYPVGAFVTVGTHNMAVDGSTTPVVYGLRNTDQAIGTTVDITRIVFRCLTNSSIDLSKFGDIAGGLTNGIVMRKVDDEIRNIFNVKTNASLKSLMYDLSIEQALGNQQDGFTGRLTFAGQSKIGVTVRLAPGEDLQLIVQDDLSSLDTFAIVVEGHEVI